MSPEKQIQFKLPSQKQWYGPNYLLISVLFLLPAVLFILGVILFLNSSPPAFNETKQNVPVAAPVQNLPPALPKAHKSVKPVPDEVKQPDLKKQAGNLFNYVFDEGIFSKPLNTLSSREFLKDQESQTVILRLDYDVSEPNSLSGVYFKTQGLDLSRVKHISFSAKSGEGKALPDRFRVEFRDQLSTVRRFSVIQMTHDWRLYDFDFNVNKPTNISEMTFLFEHAKVGPLAAAGTIYFKDLKIE